MINACAKYVEQSVSVDSTCLDGRGPRRGSVRGLDVRWRDIDDTIHIDKTLEPSAHTESAALSTQNRLETPLNPSPSCNTPYPPSTPLSSGLETPHTIQSPCDTRCTIHRCFPEKKAIFFHYLPRILLHKVEETRNNIENCWNVG